MSMTSVAQVRSSSKSRGSARTLLLVIASHTNPDTGWAWPSLDTLAEETAITRRHVIRLIARLEALKELEVRRGHGRGHVNFYRVHLDMPPEQVTPGPRGGPRSELKKVTSAPRKGDILDREKVTGKSPERKQEREKKGAPAFSLWPEKPEMYNPFWCDTHGYCHADDRPDCRRER